MDALEQARAEIDEVDAQLAALFERRMAAVLQVAEYKRAHGLPIFDAAREAAVLEKAAALKERLSAVARVKVDDSDLKAQLERLEFQKKLQEAKLERLRVLLKRESISVEEFQQLETEYNMNLADIELLKVKIIRTEIRAPFDGQMGFRYVSVGSYLQPSTKVSTIVDNSFLKVEFVIPEKYIVGVPIVGRKIDFEVAGLEHDISAEVYAVDPQINDKHAAILRARYRNTDNLMAGMFVKGQWNTAEGLKFILIPTEAVVPEMNGKRLWVLKNGKATSVAVQTESRDNKFVEVTAGIQIGDTVLTGGLMQLREGMAVDVSLNN